METIVYTGKVIAHDGQHVWLQANGGGITDSVMFPHTHNNPEGFTRVFGGTTVHIVRKVRNSDSRVFHFVEPIV